MRSTMRSLVTVVVVVAVAGPGATTGQDELQAEPEFEQHFIRGDSNLDGAANISDMQYTLNFLFLGGPEVRCLDAADWNDDGVVDISDPLAAMLGGGFLWIFGPPPPNACGPDPTDDDLDCAEYPRCD